MGKYVVFYSRESELKLSIRLRLFDESLTHVLPQNTDLRPLVESVIGFQVKPSYSFLCHYEVLDLFIKYFISCFQIYLLSLPKPKKSP